MIHWECRASTGTDLSTVNRDSTPEPHFELDCVAYYFTVLGIYSNRTATVHLSDRRKAVELNSKTSCDARQGLFACGAKPQGNARVPRVVARASSFICLRNALLTMAKIPITT